MKPYLAIIYDSFIESLRSKVLWVLLIGWTLVLAALAPFGFIVEVSYEFQSMEIRDRDRLTAVFGQLAKGGGTVSQRGVWECLSKPTQQSLKERLGGGQETQLTSGTLAQYLNEVLRSRGLYTAERFPRAERRSDLQELLEMPADRLSDEQLIRRNRRLIELAFPVELTPVNPNRVWVAYAGFRLGSGPLPVSLKQARQFLEPILLGFMKFGLGVVAVFVALVVTSPMIPEMFQSGSLYLLLSKPISRSWLFLAKFAGGCAFVALNIAYLLTGLYFIAGYRLGLWNAGLFACIPVFVFIFSIYYSVSAVSGLIWKNAVVSMVLTFLFWLFCFALGGLRGYMQMPMEISPQIVDVQQVDDVLMATTHRGLLQIWDADQQRWQPAYGLRGDERRVLGPIWQRDQQRLLFARVDRNPLARMMGGGARLGIADLRPEGESGGGEQVASATEGNDEAVEKSSVTSASADRAISVDATKIGARWSDARLDTGPGLPAQPRRFEQVLGEVELFCETGIWRYRSSAEKPAQGGFELFGMRLPLPGSADQPFQLISPDGWQPQGPMDAAVDAQGKAWWVYHRARLEQLRRDPADQRLQLDARAYQLDWDSELLVLVAATDRYVLLVAEGQTPRLLDIAAGSIETVDALGAASVRSVIACPTTGRFAGLTPGGDVWWLWPQEGRIERPRLAGQGKASGMAFREDGALWVAHHVDQVDLWSSDGSTTEAIARPSLTNWQRFYYWGVVPVYTVNPKPAAMDSTLLYLLQREETFGLQFDALDLESARQEIDPWSPLWSNMAFVGLLLAAGCWLLYRQDL